MLLGKRKMPLPMADPTMRSVAERSPSVGFSSLAIAGP
jgi:hypothetical protein